MSLEMHLESVREGLITDAGQFLLIVGEDNPRSAAPKFALYPLPVGCSGHRLCGKVMGLRPATYLSIWRTNLCTERWSKRIAAVRANILGRPGTPWRQVILLGRKVAAAFGFGTKTYFDVWDGGARTGDKRFALLPHPSGLNRLWNDRGSYDLAVEALRSLDPDIPWRQV